MPTLLMPRLAAARISLILSLARFAFICHKSSYPECGDEVHKYSYGRGP